MEPALTRSEWKTLFYALALAESTAAEYAKTVPDSREAGCWDEQATAINALAERFAQATHSGSSPSPAPRARSGVAHYGY